MFMGRPASLGAFSLVVTAIIIDCAASTVIDRDVVILAGGASGAHAGVRLREDYNKSVVIVEKQDRLHLPLLSSYETFPDAAVGIPEDLTMKFVDFAKKYQIEAAVPRIFQAFGAPITRFFLGIVGSFVSVSRRNQDIYDAIAELLGSDVLYSSIAVETIRTEEGVEVLVQSADNTRTLIRAKKLVVSFEPTLDNLKGISIDEQETAVFCKWKWSTVYAGVVSHPSLPTSFSYTSTDPKTWLSIPELSFVGRFDYLGGDNYRVLVTGGSDFTSLDARELVKSSVVKLASAGTIPSLGDEPPQIKSWADHGPMHLHVSGDELEAGFVTDLYALQGRKSTFFTGGAWSVQFTTILWEFNNRFLLPKLLAEL
ncbi:amine oxidase [Colletotrichum sojae]|uniref:Amine oxidase n=1 Tax=Colletotrichum sojae TaxID=2175907 RepID=A0A8H6J189_9PEZI|nr:amine oxidase [Colletotrichum sojae]